MVIIAVKIDEILVATWVNQSLLFDFDYFMVLLRMGVSYGWQIFTEMAVYEQIEPASLHFCIPHSRSYTNILLIQF